MNENTMTLDSITPESIREAGFSPTVAAKVIGSAKRDADRQHDQTEGSLMYRAALLSVRVKADHLIGTGKGAVWPRQQDYAAALGWSGTYASLLLGTLASLADAGVTPDDDVWTFATKNGANGRVTKAVKAASTGKGLTRAKAAKALAPLVKAAGGPSGRLPSAKAEKKTAAKKPTPRTKVETFPGRNNTTRLDQMETILAAMTKVTPSEAKRLAEIADRIDVMLERPMRGQRAS